MLQADLFSALAALIAAAALAAPYVALLMNARRRLAALEERVRDVAWALNPPGAKTSRDYAELRELLDFHSRAIAALEKRAAPSLYTPGANLEEPDLSSGYWGNYSGTSHPSAQ